MQVYSWKPDVRETTAKQWPLCCYCSEPTPPCTGCPDHSAAAVLRPQVTAYQLPVQLRGNAAVRRRVFRGAEAHAVTLEDLPVRLLQPSDAAAAGIDRICASCAQRVAALSPREVRALEEAEDPDPDPDSTEEDLPRESYKPSFCTFGSGRPVIFSDGAGNILSGCPYAVEPIWSEEEAAARGLHRSHGGWRMVPRACPIATETLAEILARTEPSGSEPGSGPQ